MTRDYKPSARKRTRRSSGSGSSLLVGILIGLLLGLGIALAVAIYLNKMPGPFLTSGRGKEPPAPQNEALKPPPSAPEKPQTAKSEDKPRFDFYNILPGTDDPAKAKGTAEPRPSAAANGKETFYLQAGAFSSSAEADNMRARLALLGIEANVQTNATAERGTLHRVRIGPFERVEEVDRTRTALKQNGIDTTLIKGRDSAN